LRGKFHCLYVVLNIWGRRIVGLGVHEEQCGAFAARLLEATCDQGIRRSSGGRQRRGYAGTLQRDASLYSL
jgi:putative transposase